MLNDKRIKACISFYSVVLSCSCKSIVPSCSHAVVFSVVRFQPHSEIKRKQAETVLGLFQAHYHIFFNMRNVSKTNCSTSRLFQFLFQCQSVRRALAAQSQHCERNTETLCHTVEKLTARRVGQQTRVSQ